MRRRLWKPICRRLGVDAPMSMRDALALTSSDPDRGGRQKKRPPVRLLALSLVFDTCCKLAAADRANVDGRVSPRRLRGRSGLRLPSAAGPLAGLPSCWGLRLPVKGSFAAWHV